MDIQARINEIIKKQQKIIEQDKKLFDFPLNLPLNLPISDENNEIKDGKKSKKRVLNKYGCQRIKMENNT